MDDSQATATPDAQDVGTPATAEPQQSLPLERPAPAAAPAAAPSAAKSEPSIAPKDLAKLMADNRTMTARLKDLEATQGKDARERQEAQALAEAERHNAELQAATTMAETAMASARRNAVKAHYRGSLKADTYLALVPQVQFTDAGDLTGESVEALDEFRKAHAELFNAPSLATTPMSASGAGDSADAMNPDMAAALRANRIPMAGDPKHWSKRASADTMGVFVGHNMDRAPWKVTN